MYLIYLALGQLTLLSVWIMVSHLLSPAVWTGIKKESYNKAVLS